MLRNEWKFDGFVVSDYTAIHELIAHGYAADAKDAALQGDPRRAWTWRWSAPTITTIGKALVDAGQLDPKSSTRPCANILRVKFRLGLFDRPSAAASATRGRRRPEALAVAQEAGRREPGAAEERDGALPLAKSVGKVAVIGPLADSPVDQMGTWALDGEPATCARRWRRCGRCWARRAWSRRRD